MRALTEFGQHLSPVEQNAKAPDTAYQLSNEWKRGTVADSSSNGSATGDTLGSSLELTQK